MRLGKAGLSVETGLGEGGVAGEGGFLLLSHP